VCHRCSSCRRCHPWDSGSQGRRMPGQAAAPSGNPKGWCRIGGAQRVILTNADTTAGTSDSISTPASVGGRCHVREDPGIDADRTFSHARRTPPPHAGNIVGVGAVTRLTGDPGRGGAGGSIGTARQHSRFPVEQAPPPDVMLWQSWAVIVPAQPRRLLGLEDVDLDERFARGGGWPGAAVHNGRFGAVGVNGDVPKTI
jgi:hypothetical protein